ncbi:MAG: Uma2 family endonuclease [Planctomycetaceae bacterium]|nr:Uma2 family endonuclease [Planctomycetaceae bacterium]
MPITAEEFAEQRWDLPEDGRWTELVAGEIVQLLPPNTLHGTSVLNLSKRLAEFRQQNPGLAGAACFDQGLITRRQPDSVFVPAVAFIPDVGPFELADQFLTEKCPLLAVEVVSSNDRRNLISSKVEIYLEAGVQSVWVIDLDAQDVLVVDQSGAKSHYSGPDHLTENSILPGFQMPVAELFQEPEWWAGSR